MFQSGKNELILRATNLHVGAEVKVPAKISGEWQVAIPAAVISSLFQNIKGQDKITLEKDGNLLKISTDSMESQTKTLPTEDFPSIPTITDGRSFTVDIKKFRNAVGQVAYAAANTDARPEISSVYIYGEQEGLVFVSTDTYRLAEKRLSVPDSDGFPAIILPIRNIVEMSSFFQNEDGQMEVIVSENQISFTAGEAYFTSRIYDGAFPDYRQIIPSGDSLSTAFLKADLQDALRMINVFSDPFHKITINLDPKKKECTFHSKNADIGEISSHVPVVFSGELSESLQTTINHRYLDDFVKLANTDNISLDFVSPQKPILASYPGDDSVMYLIMPMNR